MTRKSAVLRRVGTVVLSVLMVSAAMADDTKITGKPEVIDADILKFGKQRVILWGIDAPEQRQNCQIQDVVWGCHDAAKRQLQLLAGRGDVTCTYQGEPDPFGRRYGICESGGEDLNAAMVSAGLALAFDEQTDMYDAAMAEAIGASAGLWQVGVKFEEPWIFRRRETPGGFR